MSSDEQADILRNIWTEMKALNQGVDETNERLDKTNERLDAVRTDLKGELRAVREELKEDIDGLRRRGTESEVRLATATTQLASDVQELTKLIRSWREEHRGDRADVQARLLRVEQQVGLVAKP